MEISKLSYGSFEKILREYMAPNVTYEELANALLLSPLITANTSEESKQSIYVEYHIEETTIAKIRNGKRSITKELLRDYLVPDALENVEHYFSAEIIPYIPMSKRQHFIDDLLAVILQDEEIAQQEKMYYSKIAGKKGLAAFLAEVYIHAITGISTPAKNTAKSQTTNLPNQNRFFCGRDNQLADIEKNYENGVHAQSIYGMGGVGKTQIALQYAYTHKEQYKIVWWINAENKVTIHNSISDFLVLQGQILEDKNTDEVRSIFVDYFSLHTEWLLVYDNAEYGTPEEYDTLLAYFPQNVSSGNILITTRCKNPFEHAAHMEIPVWNTEEATDFLEQHSGISDEANARKLAEQMGYLPLALEYAAAYIRETPGVDYVGYSKKLKQYGVKVLDRRVGHQMYKRTVRQAFHITLDRLLADSAIDLLARSAEQFLNICAFLASDGINICQFSHYGQGLPEPVRSVLVNELDRDELVRLLTRYSLVQIEQDNMSMHRLLQEILRDELASADEILCINCAYGVFYSIFYSMRNMTIQEMRPLLMASVPHVQVILHRYVQHCKSGGQNISDGIMVAKEYFSWTSLLLTDTKQLEPAELVEAYKRDVPILQTAIEFYELLPGCGTIYMAYTIMLLAQANAKLGNTETAFEQYDKALRITDEVVYELPIDIVPNEAESVLGLYRTEAFLLVSDICAAIASSETIYEHTDLLWNNYHSLMKLLLKQFVCFPYKEDAHNYREALLDLWIYSQQIADYTGRAFVLRLRAPESWLVERECLFLDGFYAFFLPEGDVEAGDLDDVVSGFDILLNDNEYELSEVIDESWATLAFGEDVKTLDDMLHVLVKMERGVHKFSMKRALRSAIYMLAKKLGNMELVALYRLNLI